MRLSANTVIERLGQLSPASNYQRGSEGWRRKIQPIKDFLLVTELTDDEWRHVERSTRMSPMVNEQVLCAISDRMYGKQFATPLEDDKRIIQARG